MAQKYQVPDLSNATPGFLIDEIGRLRSEKKRIEFLEGVYKQALEARSTEEQRRGVALIEGATFVAQRVCQTQLRISAEKVQEELKDEPDRLARCYGEITFWQLNVNAIVKEV